MFSQYWTCAKWSRPTILIIYLLLNEFEVRTVSYGPRFMARALRAWAINRRGKTRVSYIYIWRIRKRFLWIRNGLQIESKTNQFEIVFKSLARFSTQFRVKESFKLYLLYKLRTCGDKSRNSLATKTTLYFSGPCRKIRPAKLTNHSARTNLEI